MNSFMTGFTYCVLMGFIIGYTHAPYKWYAIGILPWILTYGVIQAINEVRDELKNK